ncbi:hypothetical protein BKA82DRAFT_4236029 [Pisolithus tinctorius]|nr:hypothetical protein BKA82DRAFT_4236029 [Pisolithus tinctorius]
MWPFTTAPSPFVALEDLSAEYDFIVVGGGNAGCVLARRLSEDPSKTVLLVERGDGDDSWLTRVPLTSTYQFSDGKHSNVFSSVYEERIGRSVTSVTGLGLGGCTRQRLSFDSWSRDGRHGWSYAELKPFFKKSETWLGRDRREYHGYSGPLYVESYEGYYFKSFEAVEKACRRILPTIEDMHSPTDPSIGWKDRLHVCTGALARNWFLIGMATGQCVRGVEIQGINSDSVSSIGVGPRKHLQEMNVNVVLDSPGVGEHLQDHLIVLTGYNCPLFDSIWAMIVRPTVLIRELYNYLRYGTGWFLGTLVELEIFFLSSLVEKDGRVKPISKEREDPFNPENIPDIAILPSPLSDPRVEGANKWKGLFGLNPALLKVTSRGSLPEIARKMCDAGYPLKETYVPKSLEDADLDVFIQERADSMYHYSSTCRMAPLDDPLPGVVDNDLRVHGTTNLRIVDASIFPAVPATHPQALVYAVAEKCADMIVKGHSSKK